MDKLYWLDQIKLQDRAKVGDKAFYLSKIMQRGYPVVPGFVVSAEILRQFLENLNSSESLVADLPHSSLHLDVANWRQLQQVAGRLRQEILTATVPQQWVSTIFQAAKEWQTSCLILRPTLSISNTAPGIKNISGLLESVFCQCEPEAIAWALKRTWSQIFRARSLLYWQRAGINLQQINLAVLVQPVENAIASGLLKANSSGWEIEATWGLGIAIALGEVQPDIYYIQQATGVVLEQQLGNKMLAYGVNDAAPEAFSQPTPNSVLAPDHIFLSTYVLQEAQQEQYALQEEYLQQIIALGTQLVSELGKTFTIKWTIAQQTTSNKLYITQVSSPQSVIPYGQFIRGLGAAGGRVVATALVINNSQHKPEQLPKDVILVVPTITPDWLPLLHQVAGIITEQGGLTSHAAILARELRITAVVNATSATTLIQTGERLLLDGDRGEVYRIKGDSKEEMEKEREEKLLSPHQPNPKAPYPTFTSHLPMIATQLLVNLSQSSLIEQVQSFPVDGVGLLRSELMVLNILDGQHPNTWILGGRQAELLELWSEQIRQFARAFAPRPVFYRSLDWRSQDLPSLSDNLGSPPQSMLGERGTFSYLRNPAVFELELQALANVQQAGYTNVNLLLPFVRTVEEFVFCRRKVEQALLTEVSQFQLWMMAEVPSVLFLLPEYVKAGAAGISIGTNDLTQLLLGVDREQGQLAKVFNERHPAVMGAIAQLIQMAQSAGIPCSICGQAPALYPEIIDKLVEWGITSISVEPEALERTYQAIARAEQRLILAAARRRIH
ncbi:phosphoenolpyruvate synthase [Nostoc sp. UCD121]|uniref:putative PEP-binding protein n=1 Tax=unclassified Nostoc TaxID=2593658 RepID=UPI0016234446|nr:MULTISPECIES: putative PEP-binding protein [unclassified Nostoc]MBC1219438.1 phosphoenolpyruvate synthase [Nostoc sp. UCD120]MBC1275214.1 phosphoenolpyruvate synthase [Nostoc sp. UCD121]MBC1294212.1 phosphoenolpyruvate synthase [Nostoc sp. UCD122]